jgi:hypothetical protein
MSLIETIFASALLLVVFLAAVSFILQLRKSMVKVSNLRVQAVEFQKLATQISSDPKLFKINFDPSETSMCAALDSSKLPLAWNQDKVLPVADCSACPGRVGYVIQPFPISTVRGVYLVTFRFTHTELTKGETFKCDGADVLDAHQFQMIVSLK